MKHIQTFESFLSEGNAFLAARAKAMQEGLEEFEFNGKIFKVTTKTSKINEYGKKKPKK